MFDFLRKKLEETLADLNPFDNGRTGETVRQERAGRPAPAQTVSQNRPTTMPAQTRPFKTGIEAFNAPRALPKPIPSSTPRPNIDPGKWIGDNIVKPAAETATKAVNTAALLPASVGAVVSGEYRKPEVQEKLSGLLDRSFIPREVASGKASPIDFAKSFTDAGVETSNLVPAKGVATGLVNGLSKAAVKTALVSNAKQAAVYGTATNANDTLQGREVTPSSIAANYALPFAVGSGAEIAGGAIKSGVGATRNRVNEIQAQPGYNSQSGFLKTPTSKAASDLVDFAKATKEAAVVGRQYTRDAETSTATNIRPIDKVKDFISGNFTDDTAYFQALDRQVAGRNALGRIKPLPADQRIDPQIQAFRNANSVIDQRVKDFGVEDFAKSFPNQKLYDAYQVYRVNRAGLSRAGRERKPSESLDEAYARFTGGRNLIEDERVVGPLRNDPFYDSQFGKEREIYNAVLRERGANPNFKLTSEEAEQIIKNDADYAALNRILPEDKITMQRQGAVGSLQGKNVRELAKGSKSLPVEDTVTTLKNYVGDFVRKDLGNNTMNTLLKNVPEKFKPIVTSEQLKAKSAAKLKLSDLRKESDAVYKSLKKNKKASRQLESELTSLNNEGFKASQKSIAEKQDAPKVRTKLVTKTIREQIKNNAPQRLDDLKQSYGVKASLLKEYGPGKKGVEQMAADIHNGGWSQLMALNPNITKATAQSIAEQVLKKPTIKPGRVEYSSEFEGKNKDVVKAVVNSLINERPRDIQRILDKISVREPKFNEVRAEIETLLKKADDIRSERAGVISETDLSAFKAKAGENYRRRVIDGEEEIYEVKDARLAQNLNNLSNNQVSQAARILGVPTRVFRFFTTGTGNLVGFAPIAVTRDILSTALFAKAPIRAIVDPRTHIDALAAAFKKGNLYTELQRKGIGGTMVESERKASVRASDLMRKKGLAKAGYYLKHPSEAIRAVENVDAFTERITRARLASARYRQQLGRYRRQGLDEATAKDKALFDAAEEYREGALNFGRSGTVTKNVGAVVAYLNPAVQAGNKLRRSFLESPVGTAFRLATIGTALTGVWAWNNSDEERKRVWDSIDAKDKTENIIILGPTSKFDPATGKASDIIKIPLPQEYRPLTAGVDQMYKETSEQDYGKVALNSLTALTGLDVTSLNNTMSQLFPTTAKPAVENVANYSFFKNDKLTPDYISEAANGNRTLESNNSTTGTAKAISRATGGVINPIQADNLLSGVFGGSTKDRISDSDSILKNLGIISNEDAKTSSAYERLIKRYTESYGESNAIKYFDTLDTVRKTIPDSKERKQFDSLHEKTATPGLLDSAIKYQMFLNSPDIVRAERQLDKFNRDQGKAGNPLFELDPEQLKKVLTYRSMKLANSAGQNRDKNNETAFIALGLDEKWHNDFKDKEKLFYDAISKDKSESDEIRTFSGQKKPVLSPEQEQVQDLYFSLPSKSSERKQLLNSNPWLKAYWDESADFTNKERDALGFKPIVEKEYGFNGRGFGGRGRGRKSGGMFDYKLTGFGSSTSNSKQLYDMLKKARSKKRSTQRKKYTPKS